MKAVASAHASARGPITGATTGDYRGSFRGIADIDQTLFTGKTCALAPALWAFRRFSDPHKWPWVRLSRVAATYYPGKTGTPAVFRFVPRK